MVIVTAACDASDSINCWSSALKEIILFGDIHSNEDYACEPTCVSN